MLWFDNDSNSDLTSKVARAANYYTGKYGGPPNLCFVHPSMALIDEDNVSVEQKINAGDIEVRLTNSVLPHHFWIGTHAQN